MVTHPSRVLFSLSVWILRDNTPLNWFQSGEGEKMAVIYGSAKKQKTKPWKYTIYTEQNANKVYVLRLLQIIIKHYKIIYTI